MSETCCIGESRADWKTERQGDVWFTPTKLDLLRTELSRQESLCAAKTTGRTQRFCFTAG